jgi:TRAP-type C4-dicarboxylate transport system permease small subunit
MTDTAPWRAMRHAIEVWAVLGGVVLAGLVLVNTWAVLGGTLGIGFAGDVELTEMGVAVAVFSFLGHCQLNRLNVRADLFTQRTGPRWRRALDTLATSVALGFAALLLWRMSVGFVEQRAFGYSSTILQVPIWWVYLPILVSLALLVVAAVMSLVEDLTQDP